jgi:hypothetical protein
MEVPGVGRSQRLEPLSDADGETVVSDNAQDTSGEAEPEEKPVTGIRRGNRIGWWW